MTRAKTVLAAVNALQQCLVYTHVSQGWRRSGLWPRDPNMSLSNPRIVENDTITMEDNPKTRLPIVGGVITSSEVIARVVEKENDAKRRKNSKKFENFINS